MPDALGPVPQSPFDWLTLNKLLAEMVAQRGGNLIYDVEMVHVVDNVADQGYYESLILTKERFNTICDNIQSKATTTSVWIWNYIKRLNNPYRTIFILFYVFLIFFNQNIVVPQRIVYLVFP